MTTNLKTAIAIVIASGSLMTVANTAIATHPPEMPQQCQEHCGAPVEVTPPVQVEPPVVVTPPVYTPPVPPVFTPPQPPAPPVFTGPVVVTPVRVENRADSASTSSANAVNTNNITNEAKAVGVGFGGNASASSGPVSVKNGGNTQANSQNTSYNNTTKTFAAPAVYNQGLSSLGSTTQGGVSFTSYMNGSPVFNFEIRSDSKISSRSLGLTTIFGGASIGGTDNVPTTNKDNLPVVRVAPLVLGVGMASSLSCSIEKPQELASLFVYASADPNDEVSVKHAEKISNRLSEMVFNKNSCSPKDSTHMHGNGTTGNGSSNGGGFTGVETTPGATPPDAGNKY